MLRRSQKGLGAAAEVEEVERFEEKADAPSVPETKSRLKLPLYYIESVHCFNV